VLTDFCLPDPFADAETIRFEDLSLIASSKKLVHIRLQIRNGTKCITTVSGLSKELDFKRILKALKKLYACNGTVLQDSSEQVLQLQGDHRKAIQIFLIQEEICELSDIRIHGY
jgi:translation initiation factor 1